jgi:hypothetical protein
MPPGSRRAVPAASLRPAASPRPQFNREELAVIQRLRTPTAVQHYFNELKYNDEPQGATLRSFRGVVRHGTAHCLEAALAAAVILEQHGYPPLVLSFESVDKLDHVIFVYRTARGWGSVARSRDPGLHGRKPVFTTPRNLALSYVDPYVDFTGAITAYAVVNLESAMAGYDWRLSDRNVWKVERVLLEWPHRPIRTSARRIAELRRRYRRYMREHAGRKPLYYSGRARWTALPREFT